MFRPILLQNQVQQPEQLNSRFPPIKTTINVEIDAIALQLPKPNELVTVIINLLLKHESAATSMRLPLMYLRNTLNEHHEAYISALPALENMKSKIRAHLELSEHLNRSISTLTVDTRVLLIPLFDDVLVCLYFMMAKLELLKHEYLLSPTSSFLHDLSILRNMLQIADMLEFTRDVNEIVKSMAKYEERVLARNPHVQYNKTSREVTQERREQSRTPQAQQQDQATVTWLFGNQQRPTSPEPHNVSFDDKSKQSPKCTLM